MTEMTSCTAADVGFCGGTIRLHVVFMVPWATASSSRSLHILEISCPNIHHTHTRAPLSDSIKHPLGLATKIKNALINCNNNMHVQLTYTERFFQALILGPLVPVPLFSRLISAGSDACCTSVLLEVLNCVLTFNETELMGVLVWRNRSG